MTTTAIALLGFITWFLALLLTLGGLRTSLTLRGKHRPNNFKPTGEDVSEFSARLCRAHANCYESFPWLGGLMLLAMATGNTAITDPLALIMLAARVAQSATHLISTSVNAVTIRFVFFVIQAGIALWWVIRFVQLATM